jgi:hypothetical protein
MKTKRLLTCAVVALAGAFPAAASAQVEIPPPTGDNYLDGIFVSDPDAPGRFPSQPIGFIADTTNYTVQQDMYAPQASGGPVEPTVCGNATYGNTVWSFFRSDRWGLMRISTSGTFDSVIGVIPLRANPVDDAAPQIDNGACYDGLSGFSEDALGLVSPRQWYAVQVGGTGTPQGSRVQVTFDLNAPPNVGGDTVLSWAGTTRGIKVTKLAVRAPRGARVAIRCAKRKCGKVPRPFTARKGAAFSASIARRAGADDGHARLQKQSGQPAVRAAKTYAVLKGKRLKAGTRLEIRISRQGYIGTYYSYKVVKAGAETKVKRCMNPGSSKPRKRCHG